ncbi:MAG: hydrogenase expression/formation protein HypE [Desulfobacterales bacterium]|nr:hydrogenase expression/formation protein HypE [Desulfobacterales bacterium]MBF0396101.1 hydrogenase expression/formation protein HypE [Desulfobacterales bacterium]
MGNNILLDHGSGGKISNDLISSLILPVFNNDILSRLNDGAEIDINGQRLAFSTDSYVVDPIFFPGGNIGDLAINGTVNDLSMCGAAPLYLSTSLIIEEGFPIFELEKILKSMGLAAINANVKVVCGDTKVVPKGAMDKIFINTSGIGIIYENVKVSSELAQPCDQIILSGTIADHGVTILTQRENLSFESSIISDTAALNHLIKEIFSLTKEIHVLRDPTRGGVATALNEIALSSNVGIKIYEDKIKLKDEVSAVCDVLGLDPLYIANEGKFLAFVAKNKAQDVLYQIKKNPLGRDAEIIGEVVTDHPKMVVMETHIGGKRIISMLSGEQFPRIC